MHVIHSCMFGHQGLALAVLFEWQKHFKACKSESVYMWLSHTKPPQILFPLMAITPPEDNISLPTVGQCIRCASKCRRWSTVIARLLGAAQSSLEARGMTNKYCVPVFHKYEGVIPSLSTAMGYWPPTSGNPETPLWRSGGNWPQTRHLCLFLRLAIFRPIFILGRYQFQYSFSFLFSPGSCTSQEQSKPTNREGCPCPYLRVDFWRISCAPPTELKSRVQMSVSSWSRLQAMCISNTQHTWEVRGK
ncbi:hypothetical protein DIPPA_62992 [Diplonema papillatum]|nr:hypothetical protein DIPPA_62992 [Diplonema papillatum]